MVDQLSSLPVRSSTSRPTLQTNLSPEGRVHLRDNTRLLLFGVGILALRSRGTFSNSWTFYNSFARLSFGVCAIRANGY